MKILLLILPPLLSLFIITLGGGLFNTLTTLRLHLDGESSLIIGAISAAYYLGFVIGSFCIEKLVVRVGHIRTFAAFASLLAFISIFQGILVTPWSWFLLRIVAGICTAGFYVVIESWLLAVARPTTRGRILALYMIALYGSQALGQLLLNLASPKEILLFAIGSMLCSLAVIPIALTYVRAPKIHEPSLLSFSRLYQLSPTGVMGCFCSGLILGAIYGLVPLYISQVGGSVADVAFLMMLLIFGGMFWQFPVGRLSDLFDRRIVLIIVSLLTVFTAILITFTYHHYWLLAGLLFTFGGLTFTLYPVSISHACDVVKNKDIIAATQGLLLAYSLGAAMGPLSAPLFMNTLGPNGLFINFMLICLFLILFFSWRMTRTERATEKERQDFVGMPRSTPIASELDPRSEQ